MNKRHAFTLIEMLVVIAIIGIVAAMVAGMASAAKVKQRAAQVTAGKTSLTMMIESYQSKLNFFPPDNGLLATTPAGNYDALAATNPLLYELTGATNNYLNSANILLFNGTNEDYKYYNSTFARTAVNNANADEPHDFYIPGPQPKDYTNYTTPGVPLMYQLQGLIVPVGVTTAPSANYWHYDSSTTNRHNITGYDLWAEYISTTKGGSNIVVTNGNW
jgi:prepilin-type N-terminal cleavage/methylation domain-containing protein